MFASILGILSAPLLDHLLAAYQARLTAANEQGKQALDLAISAIQAEQQARIEANKIIIAEQGRWYTALPRVLVEYSAAIFVVKVVVYDIVLGLGTTDPIRGDVGEWMGLLMVMWFGGAQITRIASSVRGWWRK